MLALINTQTSDSSIEVYPKFMTVFLIMISNRCLYTFKALFRTNSIHF